MAEVGVTYETVVSRKCRWLTIEQIKRSLHRGANFDGAQDRTFEEYFKTLARRIGNNGSVYYQVTELKVMPQVIPPDDA